jgi:hypothetical protein
MSKAITEERDDRTAARSALPDELAPSILRDEEPQLARTIGLCSALLVLIGADLLCWAVFHRSGLRWLWGFWLGLRRISVPEGGPPISALATLLATISFVSGLGGLLYHATTERGLALRRGYGALGFLWLAVGTVLVVGSLSGGRPAMVVACVLGVIGLAGLGLLASREPDAERRQGYAGLAVAWLVIGGGALFIAATAAAWGTAAFAPGFAAGILALVFGLASLRHETDEEWHEKALYLVLGAGAALAAVAFVGTLLQPAFLVQAGFLLGALGLVYVWAFIVARGRGDDLGHLAGVGAGLVGAAVILVTLLRLCVWPLLAAGRAVPYLVPTGVLLLALGGLYVLLYVLLYVERPVVVMARRELTGFFYSPIAYLVLLGFTVVGWIDLWMFLDRAIVEPGQQPLFEPIVRTFFFGIVPVFAIIFIVPVVTMRTLSEEKRTGTLELLLTVPVDEWSVVLGKFLATLVFFLIIWVPWSLFLVALRLVGGPEAAFDYRPLLSFFIVLVCTGANFVGMGMFFSGITRNQIIAAVLTFAAMFAQLFLYFALDEIRSRTPSSPWVPVLSHVSFIDLWLNSLDGKLQPVFLLFHLSATAFWLYLTVKVLEARRWS